MRTISRPAVDRDFMAGQVRILSAENEESIPAVEDSPQELSALMGTILMETGYRCALDAKAQYLETWESVVSAMQVGSAIFETGSRSEGVVECRIAHKIWQVPATGPQYWTNVRNWLTALWLAMICRERGRARRLAETPLELLRASGEQFDDFEFPWVESLQMFWRNEQGLFDKLMPAMKATAPEQIRVTTTEYALLQVWPTMRTFYHLVQGENEQFNEVLAEAVQLHKDYWTADEERAKDPDGFISLGPLAMACLARDWDVAVEVESEYLPEHLIRGTWVGEFRHT